MKRLAGFLTIMVAAAVGIGVAAPSASPPPVLIAKGVNVADVEVGGLSAEPARARVRAWFDRPLRFRFDRKRFRVTPKRLGAWAELDRAVSRALRAAPGRRVSLEIGIREAPLRRYVASLDRLLERPAENAELVGLSNLRPLIRDARPGLRVRRQVMHAAIRRAIRWGNRRPIPVITREVEPTLTREDFGPIIVIHRASNVLNLYDADRLWRSFRVATGQPEYPTPLGQWSIATMERNPWWRPPPSDWAKGLEPVPPGPGNPLGTRWMGLTAPAVGIHATPDAASIGYSASHGCIRMHVADAEWLFEQVGVGTPVFVVDA